MLSEVDLKPIARSSSDYFLYNGGELMLELGLGGGPSAGNQTKLRLVAVGYNNLHERLPSSQIDVTQRSEK